MTKRTAHRVQIAVMIATCLMTGTAVAADVDTRQDTLFLAQASESGKAEMALGLLASDRAQSAKVKEFGQRMIEDHQKAGMEVKQLALREGIDLPAAIAPVEKKNAETLSQLSGKAFDRAYMGHMVKDHTKDVTEFERSAQGLNTPLVQQWASVTLPVLKEHLKLAKSIADDLETPTK
jgi:putative membrane protein